MVKAMITAPATVNQTYDMSCVYCGEAHLFDNCPSNPASVNYMGSFNRQNQDNLYLNTYNPGWRQHPNVSWNNQNQPAAAPSGQNRLATHLDFISKIKSKEVSTMINLALLKV